MRIDSLKQISKEALGSTGIHLSLTLILPTHSIVIENPTKIMLPPIV